MTSPVETSVSVSDPSQQQQQQQPKKSKQKRQSSGNGAATALALLLREDPLLTRHNLTTTTGGGITNPFDNNNNDSSPSKSSRNDNTSSSSSTAAANEEAAFSYAAALLHEQDTTTGWMSSSGGEVQQRATEALAEVDRKLMLVESLAQRVSRDRPLDVAGPLLSLHGLEVEDETTKKQEKKQQEQDDDAPTTTTNTTTATLTNMKERCNRLRRQGEVLDTIGHRVETTLQRGLTRMEKSTTRLSRVLHLSSTLKMMLRLKFEYRKVQGSGLDLESLSSSSGTSSGGGNKKKPSVDLRDLTRAAASVAVTEELLSHPDLNADEHGNKIDVVEQMRPEAERVSAAVRRAAAGLLAEQQQQQQGGSSAAAVATTAASVNAPARLGATLQVYFHLGELPQAAWGAVEAALASAERATGQFFNPAAVQRLMESAAVEARILAENEVQSSKDETPKASSSEGKSGGVASLVTDKRQKKKQMEVSYERFLRKKLCAKRAEAADKWAAGITEASLRVWTLHRVLVRKSDPTTRINFLEVVKCATVPEKFQAAEEKIKYSSSGNNNAGWSIFALFWNQVCIGLGARIQRLLRYDNGSMAKDVATLYPAVRSAALGMVSTINDAVRAGSAATAAAAAAAAASNTSTVGVGGGNSASIPVLEDGASAAGGVGGGGGMGIMGGCDGLDDAAFLGWTDGSTGFGIEQGFGGSSSNRNTLPDEADAGGGGVASADSWTMAPDPASDAMDDGSNNASSASGAGGGRMGRIAGAMGGGTSVSTASSSSFSAIFSSAEWMALQGGSTSGSGSTSSSSSTATGLFPLQRAFLTSSSERLNDPIQYMFPEAVAVDENGVAITVLPSLPSRYDLAKLEKIIREELSLADPRGGGGEFSMTTMICQNIVDMVESFCSEAKSATSDVREESLLRSDKLIPTDALTHDMKLAGVMNSLAIALRNAPDNTFVTPYRPAQSPQNEEAAHMCQISLLPALHEIDTLVKTLILNPLCRAINARVSIAIAKMHRGTYLEDAVVDDAGGMGGGSFVEQHLTELYESIESKLLANLPSEYASVVASTVATYSIYSFVSNASLVRPLGEMARLRITQDLADFELALEQLVVKGGSGTALSQIENGKPYAELRAVRQMLFWTGLEDKLLLPTDAAKSILREVWAKDVRPSTVFHFLFSFAPTLLSSPHHSKRMKAEEYVNSLVRLDGIVDDGEATAWMTTMACCDAYQQRESVDGGSGDGDRRVAAILMILGPELLRRRRQ